MGLDDLKQQRKKSMDNLNNKLKEYNLKISNIIKKGKNVEETIYIFDSTKIKSASYGEVIYDRIFFLLKDNKNTIYFSSGDYLNVFDDSEYNTLLLSLLFRDIKEIKDKKYHKYETNRYFIIVIKGDLSEKDKNKMLEIEKEDYFIGKKILKNYTDLKWYLNGIIGLSRIKTDNIKVDFNHSEWDEIFVKKDEYLNFSICDNQYDVFNKNSKLEDERKFDADVLKELLKKYSIDIKGSKAAADLNFKEEVDEINLIQDMFIESKNILGEITLMSDFERELKNKQHSVYKYNELQIERVFYLHEQLFERFLKIIYIHIEGKRYLDKNVNVKKFSHDIDKVIKKIGTSNLILTEEEKEYLRFMSLYYNKKRYNTFESGIEINYLLK
ncbi:MAG: hypothetical protein ACK5HR_07225, partial [Mycoplasmatales bacterium]